MKCARQILTRCCPQRRVALAHTDVEAAVAANYFTAAHVARDNAVEAATNAADAARKACEEAAEALESLPHIDPADVEADVSETDDFTVIELSRAKSV